MNAATKLHFRPKLGFLGVGWIGRNRMEAVVKDGAAEAVLVSDPSSDAVQAALQSAPGSRAVEGLDALLAGGLDGLVIATPSAAHAEQSIAALEKGLHVFCQKPLGRNASEVRAVVAAAEKADRLLGVDLSYRFTTALNAVRDVVRAGDIGEVYAADLVFHNAYGPDKKWFYDPKLAGGGCVMDLGIHITDAMLWCLGFPSVERVSSRLLCAGKPVDHATQVEDYGAAQLVLGNGAVAQLACSWRLPAGQDAVIGVSLYGTKGGVRFANVNGSFYDFVAERFHGTSRQVLVNPPDAWGGRAAADWARRVASGERHDAQTGSELIQVASVLDRIYRGE